MPRSAATRIALAGSMAFALAVALLGAAAYFIVDHSLRVQLDDRISAELSSLVSEYRSEGETGLRAVIQHREVARATNDLGYGLFDAAGRRIAGALEAAPPDVGWQPLYFYDSAEGRRKPGRALAVDIAPGRRLVVAADRDAVNDADRLILTLLAAALGLTIAIGTGGAVLLATYLRRRLSVMAEGAEAIIAGDLRQRMPVGIRRDEFDRLAAALNAMLDRITGLLDNLRQVSSDIAHDLRQPLTRLRNVLEQGLAGTDPKATTERAIAQVDEVLALFGSMLRLSEIEAGKLRAGFAPVDLARLAADLGETYAPAIEDGGRHLVIAAAATGLVHGDAELLSQAVVNLLDNAQLHTPPGTIIRLETGQLSDHARITVADDGPGIMEQDRARVLERFTRLETSRRRPGHGLGLSLVAAIARAHDSTLTLDSNRPGLIVTLEIGR